MANAPGSITPVRAATEIWETVVLLDVGASGAMTVKYGKGISSVAATATGKYTVTFTEVGSKLLDMQVSFHLAANAESYVARPTVDSFSASAKTAAFEVWEIDETQAQKEPASGSDCCIRVTWLKTV